MIREVLGGLRATVAGARLRQHQRKSGAPYSARGALPVGRAFCFSAKIRLRADDAVIVLDLVGELQRAARCGSGILGQRDGRRAIRDGGEREGRRRRRARLSRWRCRDP
jgi:hypothetical protein